MATPPVEPREWAWAASGRTTTATETQTGGGLLYRYDSNVTELIDYGP